MKIEPSTRERLIVTAERLFAEKGLDGASLRDITKGAGCNLAAVNYHFGSKEGLLREVLGARLNPINQRRVELLGALEERGELSLESLLEAFIRPAMDEPPSNHFVQLMARIHHSQDAVTSEVLGDVFGPVAKRYLTALAELLPSIPPERIFLRMQFVVGAMLHSLFTKCDSKAQQFDVPVQELDDEGFLAEFVCFCAAGLRHE